MPYFDPTAPTSSHSKILATYLDFAIEYSGYLYVLSYTGSGHTYRLDIYTPGGAWLVRTRGGKRGQVGGELLARSVYLELPGVEVAQRTFPSRTEPSVSHWTPSLP